MKGTWLGPRVFLSGRVRRGWRIGRLQEEFYAPVQIPAVCFQNVPSSWRIRTRDARKSLYGFTLAPFAHDGCEMLMLDC